MRDAAAGFTWRPTAALTARPWVRTCGSLTALPTLGPRSNGSPSALAFLPFGADASASSTASSWPCSNFARLELFDPEVCFCERPLDALGPVGRSTVLSWMNERAARGTVFVTAGQPLREALLMPGVAFWEDEGRYIAAEVAPEGDPEPAAGSGPDEAEEPLYAGDEVRICKIPAKSDAATLLFDPREIDFIESMNKANYVSVRGELYQTSLTMEELDGELAPFGFFRCHRSYIVNVQRVAKVERYTRNAFNLTLSDAAGTCIPLAKGRADALRATLRF